MENDRMPDLLIITDEDTLYGIEHHYYSNELSRAYKNGSLAVSTIEGYPRKYALSKHPIGNGKDCYVWNPSANVYLYLGSADVFSTLISEKSFAIKEALVRMGAKDITLVEQTTDKDHAKTDVRNTFTGPVNVDASVKSESDNLVDIKSEVESHDPNRIAKPYDQVREFMFTHGLCADAKLNMLLDRLKEDGELHGTERYTVTYLGEIKNALNIAASISDKVFSDTLDFLHEYNHVQTISKTLEINFG